MGIYLRGKNWYVRLWNGPKKIERRIGPDKKVAELAQKQLEKDRAFAKASGQEWTGLAKVKKVRQTTFSEAFSDYLEEGSLIFKPSTVRTYQDIFKAHLSKEFGHVPVTQITRERILQFQKKLAEAGKSPTRNNNVTNLLRTILKSCVDKGLLNDNPCEKVRRLREEGADIDPFTLDELQLALQKIDEHYRPIFTTLAWTGMRPNELKALRWTDIDWQRKEIRISKGIVRGEESTTKTKSGKRVIPIHPEVSRALETVRERSLANLSGYLFTSKKGQILSHHLDGIWKRALLKANIRHRPSYQLRHTWASMALESGESPSWVAKMLGHADLSTLFRHYARHIKSDKNGTLISQVGTVVPTQKSTHTA
jgi:integrase